MTMTSSLPGIGQVAPDFTIPTDSGESLTLSSLCTTQSCAFRAAFPAFSSRNAVILGVSTDSVKSHARFKARFKLPFTLLSDADAHVSKRYGVWKVRSLFGHRYMGIERTTFVIGPDGRIAHVFEKVKVRGHADAVLQVLGL